MADPLHELGSGRTREFPEQRVALLAIRRSRPHLDQFVIGERAVELGDQRRSDPGLAGQNNRLAIVSKSTEVLLLRVGEHGP